MRTEDGYIIHKCFNGDSGAFDAKQKLHKKVLIDKSANECGIPTAMPAILLKSFSRKDLCMNQEGRNWCLLAINTVWPKNVDLLSVSLYIDESYSFPVDHLVLRTIWYI